MAVKDMFTIIFAILTQFISLDIQMLKIIKSIKYVLNSILLCLPVNLRGLG